MGVFEPRPPFSAMKRWPASASSTISTEPVLPPGLSTARPDLLNPRIRHSDT